MNSAQNSLMAFGLYMMLIPGFGLMSVPGPLLDLFGLSHGNILWLPRVVGLLAFIIGVFQVSVAKLAISELYRVTVAQRYLAAVFFSGLWICGEAEVAILAFALIDCFGATWTLLATRPDTLAN